VSVCVSVDPLRGVHPTHGFEQVGGRRDVVAVEHAPGPVTVRAITTPSETPLRTVLRAKLRPQVVGAQGRQASGSDGAQPRPLEGGRAHVRKDRRNDSAVRHCLAPLLLQDRGDLGGEGDHPRTVRFGVGST